MFHCFELLNQSSLAQYLINVIISSVSPMEFSNIYYFQNCKEIFVVRSNWNSIRYRLLLLPAREVQLGQEPEFSPHPAVMKSPITLECQRRPTGRLDSTLTCRKKVATSLLLACCQKKLTKTEGLSKIQSLITMLEMSRSQHTNHSWYQEPERSQTELKKRQ